MAKLDNASIDPRAEISNFGEKVFSYSLQKFGIIYKELAYSSLFTEDIGNAVIILQLHIRDLLRDQLFTGVDNMVGVIDFSQAYQTIRHLLDLRSDKSLENHPVNTVLLGYLALITELIIFMHTAHLPVPKHWFTRIWTRIFEERLKPRFGEKGWDSLKAEAKIFCDNCPNKECLFDELKLLEHPYAEIDPRMENSFKDLDPFFMCASLGWGFEYPRRPGLSREAQDRLLRDLTSNVSADTGATTDADIVTET